MSLLAATTWPEGGRMRALARSVAFHGAKASLDATFDGFISFARELGSVPAPTFGEGARAARVLAKLTEFGLAAHVDASTSVIAALPGAVPGILLAAHTDTVFGADEDHTISAAEGRLIGRGIGDNSIGVAALVYVAAALVGLRRARALWFAATSGEEGLGDLRGIRCVADGLAGRIAGCVAIEGHFLDKIVVRGVGSRRWRFQLRAGGGHSWHDHGRPSAVHAAGVLVAALTSIRLPRRPRTSLNVGRISGGEGVNVIAREAWFELDLRSEDQSTLESYSTRVLEVVRRVAARQEVLVEPRVVGDRPAASLDRKHPLVRLAQIAARSATQATPELATASTDANYPASLGIPSLCVGVTRGAEMHGPNEWVERAAARDGLQRLLLLTATLAEVSP